MPSVQWGATSTAKLIFTPISSALGALPNAAGTIAILWKQVALTNSCDGGGLTNSAVSVWGHTAALTSLHWADDNGSVFVGNTTNPTDSNWHITVVDWPAGTAQTERFHWKNLTSAAAWVHQNASATGGTPPAGPGTTGWWHVGYAGDNGLGSGAQIALIAAWNVALGDTNAALLNTNLKTSDWYNSPAGTPIFLSEITTLTPTDLIGGSTFSGANSTTTNLTIGGDPAGGWTFDGTGTAASPVARAFLPIMAPQGGIGL